MATRTAVSPARAHRMARHMVAGQQMAVAEPSEADVDLAVRQAGGELTGDEATAKAISAARANAGRT